MQRLAPGTQVGAWRVQAWHGQGAFGAVYRAVRVGQEHLGPVALKVSVYPWDARFGREAELLSRFEHPGIPRLLDRGVLRHSDGAEYAFFVMEWVEGLPLYTWAARHAPSSQEIGRVLARLARALEAVHAAGAVHRDVKGDNVLVRLLDNSPVLLDFGSGHFQGAPRITWKSLAPFTPEYLSAQACLFDLRLARERDSYYPPTPADDLYALGVTAYRLVMGEYPPPMRVREDADGTWRVSSPDPRPRLESNPRVSPRLRDLMVRLLSDEPEVRGTATLAAEALEAVAQEPVPVRTVEPPPAAEVPARVAPAPTGGRARPVRDWRPWLAMGAVGICAVFLWSVQPARLPPGPVSMSPEQAAESQAPDAGTAGMGDTSPIEPQASTPPPTEKKPVAQQTPPEPRPGQIRPDKKGRCPGRKQVPINGGCWGELLQMSAEECVENSYVPFKGKCYAPALASPKQPQPTSSPPEAR